MIGVWIPIRMKYFYIDKFLYYIFIPYLAFCNNSTVHMFTLHWFPGGELNSCFTFLLPLTWHSADATLMQAVA